MKKIIVKAPATVANLVCGFDVLGMCLQEPFDIMEVSLLPERKVVLRNGRGHALSEDPLLNTAGPPLLEMLKHIATDTGFEVIIHKNIKPGSGLGSSSASAAGAVAGANYLLGEPFTKKELVQFAMLGEKLASGVKHADNVAPAIYGGISLIRSIFPLDTISIPAPPLFVSVVHPQIEIKTSDARQILRKEVLLKDAIRQFGNIGGLIAGLMQNDYDLMGRSLEDGIIEPLRSMLIPGFAELKKQCLERGALGGGIAGSGPSIFMFSRDRNTAEKVTGCMKEIYDRIGLPCHTYTTTIKKEGCTFDHP
jgi:homoserine kinase